MNFAGGKSEAIATYRGKGAPAHRQEIFREKHSAYEIQGGDGKPIGLHRCFAYKHLGVIQESGGCVDLEIHKRVGQTWDAFRTLRKGVLCTRKLKVQTRPKLFSRLFHSVGTLPVLTARQMSKIEKCYMAIVRSVTDEHYRKDKDRPSRETWTCP